MSVTHRPMDDPDDFTSFDRGRVDTVKIGAATINRNTFEPGWRWSESVGPIAGTASCRAHHVGVILSGRLGVETEDGGRAEIGPGEAYDIEPGHDGFVVGDEPVISIEFLGQVG
jgi:hypothetical protein